MQIRFSESGKTTPPDFRFEKIKDCSGCHQFHGSAHFRLLEEDYPQEFYAAYDARTYALCFSCHNDDAFCKAQTTTLTDSNVKAPCNTCHDPHGIGSPGTVANNSRLINFNSAVMVMPPNTCWCWSLSP